MKFLATCCPDAHILDSSGSLVFLDADNKDGENSKESGADANDKNGKAASPEPKRNKRRLVLEVGKISHVVLSSHSTR